MYTFLSFQYFILAIIYIYFRNIFNLKLHFPNFNNFNFTNYTFKKRYLRRISNQCLLVGLYIHIVILHFKHSSEWMLIEVLSYLNDLLRLMMKFYNIWYSKPITGLCNGREDQHVSIYQSSKSLMEDLLWARHCNKHNRWAWTFSLQFKIIYWLKVMS